MTMMIPDSFDGVLMRTACSRTCFKSSKLRRNVPTDHILHQIYPNYGQTRSTVTMMPTGAPQNRKFSMSALARSALSSRLTPISCHMSWATLILRLIYAWQSVHQTGLQLKGSCAIDHTPFPKTGNAWVDFTVEPGASPLADPPSWDKPYTPRAHCRGSHSSASGQLPSRRSGWHPSPPQGAVFLYTN